MEENSVEKNNKNFLADNYKAIIISMILGGITILLPLIYWLYGKWGMI